MRLGATSSATMNTARAAVVAVAGAATGPSALVDGSMMAPAVAALVNATAAHAHDYDDASFIGIGGHASAVLVPAALAVAQAESLSGREVFESIACGYEIEFAVATVVNPWHYERGFHPTSTLGVIGAAATAARLLRLSAEEAAMALALAASMSAGIKSNFGTMAKPLHSGMASYGGVLAAYLAKSGVEGSLHAYEAAQGFWDVYGNALGESPMPLATHAQDLRIISPGVGLRKRWPCCGSTHAAIDAAIGMRDGVRLTDIDSVQVFLHRRRIPHVDRPAPQTVGEARFSVQHCVAYALVHGHADFGAFTDEALSDSSVMEVRDRCALLPETAPPDSESTFGGLRADEFGARLFITFRDKTTLENTIEFPKGSDRNPLTEMELRNKFEQCFEATYHSNPARAWVTAMSAFEASDVNALLLMLSD